MVTEFLVALQFLTIVQVRHTLPFDSEALGRAGAFFPVVGFLLGAAVWALDKVLSNVVPPSLLNLVLIAVLAGLSRGFHLDGLADSADGLLGGADRQRRLAIMKESRIGAFGTLALIGIVLAKLRALDLLSGGGRESALLLCPMFGRWSCVVMAYAAPPAREEGLGALFAQGTHLRELLLASVVTITVGFFFVGSWSIALLALLGGLALAVTRYCQRRLGGVTGDTLGAIGEVVETAAFCFFALTESGGGGR